MRITFVLPHAGLAGGTRVLAAFAERLTRRGHQVVVVSTPQSAPNLVRKLKALVRGRGWPGAPEPGPSHFDGLTVDHRVIDRWRPVTDADVPDADVVVATWWETANWVAALAPRKGAKAYFVQLDERTINPDRDWGQRVAATWRLPLAKIATSRTVRDTLTGVTGETDIPVAVNGVDTELFFAPPRGKQPRGTVGFLYLDSDRKGPDVANAVLHAVSRRVPDMRVLALTAQTQRPAQELPIGVEWFVRPAQETIRALYSQCDLWLCTSRCEGFHLPPMEAMACRCPVVSTRVGGPVDMVRDGVNGYLCAVDDSDGLAARVTEVLTRSEDSWRAMSDAAYATVASYTWDDATDRFENALERAVASGMRDAGVAVRRPVHTPQHGVA